MTQCITIKPLIRKCNNLSPQNITQPTKRCYMEDAPMSLRVYGSWDKFPLVVV